MEIYLLSFGFLVIIVSAMAIGVIVANKPIKGSCGGMSALGIDTECDICGGNPKKCEEETARKAVESKTSSAKDLSYNAAEK